MPPPRIKLPRPIALMISKKLTCRDVTVLVSREREKPLTLGERFWLRLHLYVCTGCRNFKSNMTLMRAAMKHYLDKGGDGK